MGSLWEPGTSSPDNIYPCPQTNLFVPDTQLHPPVRTSFAQSLDQPLSEQIIRPYSHYILNLHNQERLYWLTKKLAH